MRFTNSELEMIYQYVVPTKAETIGGMKETVPVIKDLLTRVIMENAIEKLQKIPEPDCSQFIADNKARFLAGHENSIRRLAEAKAQQSLQPQTQQELKNTMNAMQPPQNIEEIKAGLETTEKGGVRQSIRNCLTVFQRDPLLSGAIAYNILTDRKDIIKPIGFQRESTALNDTDMKYLLLYLEETYGLTNEKKIDNAIGIVANENKYHPIRDYLNTLL